MDGQVDGPLVHLYALLFQLRWDLVIYSAQIKEMLGLCIQS